MKPLLEQAPVVACYQELCYTPPTSYGPLMADFRPKKAGINGRVARATSRVNRGIDWTQGRGGKAA